MKYTKQQAESLKKKGMNSYTRYDRPLPDVIIKDGFYIVESKMNLQETAERYSKNPLSKLGFINGAKHQSEKMYSEEEVLTILHKRDMYKWEDHKEILSLTQWFKKFICNNQK